jgi:hypothetical protein
VDHGHHALKTKERRAHQVAFLGIWRTGVRNLVQLLGDHSRLLPGLGVERLGRGYLHASS